MARECTVRFTCFLLVVAIATLGGVPLLAQDTGADDEEERAVAVGEIVVTAQKRAQNLQDVPAAVSAMAAEDLEVITAGAPDIRALSARVPSLILESSFGRAFPRFYIRGLGNTDFDLNASQPVSMIVDGIVLENPVVKGMPLFDLERVEVLRGPQGSLFGRNTPAGIVKFESKKPSQEAGGEFRLSYGTFDTVDFSGGFNVPITDTFAVRVSGLRQSRSNWVDNGHTGEKDALGGYDTWAYRVQFLYEPDDKLSMLFNVHGWGVDGTARIFRANILTPGDNDLVDGFDIDTVYQDGLNQQDIKEFGALLNLKYDFGGVTLTSLTGYESLEMFSRGDIDGGFGASFAPPFGPGFIPFPSESADGIPDLDQLTQEIRLDGQSGDITWLGGIFYFNEELQADTYSFNSLAPGNPQDGFSFQNQEAESWAVFGSVDWAATDRLNLVAGLRWTTDEKDFSAERPWPTFNTPTSAPILENTDDDFVSWDLSAMYKVNPDLNIYGRIATASRAPSIQGRILFCADFAGGTDPASNCVTVADTEDIISAEVGVKSILMDHRLRLNLTAYVFELDGQQLSAVGGEFNTSTLLNADKTEGYGLEADIEFIPTANWLMTFGASWNPTEINDENLRVAACGGGCTVLDPIDDDGVIVDGNSLPHAPDLIFNGIVKYSQSASEGLFGSLDWAYYSEKSFVLYESAEFTGDDSLEIGLRFGYAWNQGNHQVALFGRNITDEEVVRNGIDFNNLTGMLNDPRAIGIEFVGRF